MSKVKIFISSLCDKDFDVLDLRDDKELLDDILYYLANEQHATVINALNNDTKVNRERFVASLASLYPLSRNLIMAILDEYENIDHYMMDGFDVADKMLVKLQNIFRSLRDQKDSLTSRVMEYEKDIASLKTEKKKYEDLNQKYHAEIKEIEVLKKEIVDLQKKYDDACDIAIKDNLIDQKNSLEARLEKKKKANDDDRKMIRKLDEELQKYSGNMDAESQKILRELSKVVKRLPKDEE